MREVRQSSEDLDLQFTTCTPLGTRLGLPAFEQVQGFFCLSLCNQQAGDNQCFPLLLKEAEVLAELRYGGQPALHCCQVPG